MITVLIKDGDEIKGEMRIECISPFSTHGINDYSVEFAADSGADIDLRRRLLYGFNSRKYNTLALVSEALNLLELKDMEMTHEDRPGHMAREERRAWPALPWKASDPERGH